MRRYDLVVMGAGPVGLPTAVRATGLGKKVALIEREYLGGIHISCESIPSMSIIWSSRAAHRPQGASVYGVRTKEVEVDFDAVIERMKKRSAHISERYSAKRLEEMGIEVFPGEGKFISGDEIEFGGKQFRGALKFKKALIGKGRRVSPTTIPGLAEAGFLTSETLLLMTRLPKRLAVIGAGPAGCEMGQAFRRLGSAVYLLHGGERILEGEDADVALFIERALVGEGVDVILDCSTKWVERTSSGRRLHVAHPGGMDTIEVDEVLVCTTSIPNVDGLDIEAAGIDYDAREGIIVDDRLATSNKRIYAAGDVCMNYKFTHAPYAAAQIIVANAFTFWMRKPTAMTIPWSIYTDPEIAHIGLCGCDIGERGLVVDTYSVELKDIDFTFVDDEEEGLVKVHVKKGTDKILGATIVAAGASRVIGQISIAIACGIGLSKLADAIHPHSIHAEAIRRIADFKPHAP